MFTYIVISLVIGQLVFVNIGFLIYSAINWYSYFQLKLTTNKNKVGNAKEEDTIDYLINDYLITENDTHNALDGINKANFAVLISKGTDMVCFYPPVEEYRPEYEMSNTQFISVKVEIDSVEYNVRLKTREYTFYIVGNELNSDWVRYYFCKYLGIGLSSDVKYVMTIIDDNVKFVTINQEQSLVINKDSYDIFDYVEEDPDQEEEDDQEEDKVQEEDNKDLFGEEVQDKDQNLTSEDQNLTSEDKDPAELSVDRMIQLEDEIKEELQQQQQSEPDDLDMDKIIAEFDMSNVVIFSQDQQIEVRDMQNASEDAEKARGWLNLF